MTKVLKEHEVGNIQITKCIKKTTLNYTDIISNNNKFYSAELIETQNNIFIFTVYGRVGSNGVKEYRQFNTLFDAEKEFDKIIKSKIKKKYVEVKLIRADVGSDVGKAKIEATTMTVEAAKKAGIKIEEENNDSKLHTEVQGLIRTWFGITQEFIELNLDTKKCPLGQLSLDQITKGKDILEEARKIIHSKKPDQSELNNLTNQYYSNIPHNFGYTRINADVLRLDDDSKLDKAFDILDIFNDSKNVQNVISNKNAIDSQYQTLNAEFEFVDSDSATWKWIDSMMHETRASNHHFLGKLKTHKIFKLSRKNEEQTFLKIAEKIAKECGKQTPADHYSKFVKSRPDIPKELKNLYEKANILPGWHGTRRANMIGITTRGLLIRPSGVITAGSMFGDSIYLGNQSTKSINYCDVKGSYWASGANKTAYLFLVDAACGNQKIANGSHFFTKQNIKPYHSVWAKGGYSGVVNDELMLYHPTGPEQQHCLRYIVEFETLVK